MSGSKSSRDEDDSHRRSGKHSRRDRDPRSDEEDELVKQARSMIKGTYIRGRSRSPPFFVHTD
jgi:hypothetical protein